LEVTGGDGAPAEIVAGGAHERAAAGRFHSGS
jgi:hypothetical protein